MSASPLLAIHDALLDLIEQRLAPGVGESAADLLATARQLHRLAALLVRLAEALAPNRDSRRPTLPITAPLIRSILDTRRLRAGVVGADIGEPAWALILAAYEARLRGEHPSVARLGEAAALSPSTALRWTHMLCGRGIFVWESDPHDRRIARIGLTDTAAAQVESFLTTALRLSPLTP